MATATFMCGTLPLNCMKSKLPSITYQDGTKLIDIKLLQLLEPVSSVIVTHASLHKAYKSPFPLERQTLEQLIFILAL